MRTQRNVLRSPPFAALCISGLLYTPTRPQPEAQPLPVPALSGALARPRPAEASRSRSKRWRHVTAKGVPVALATASPLLALAVRARPSSRDTPGPGALAMATSAGMSLSAGLSSPGVDEVPETEKNSGDPENTYILRPIFQQRFRPSVVKDCIHAVLKAELASTEYSAEETPQLTRRLSENIKDKLKEMGFDRYKMVVQVVIGEQRGEGVLTVYSVW
ncbi:tctex1 domain-containing protein 2 isoform X2 [Heterocephalus glaber]|uniref:Tctex1 domain-containing protein 2 isoform X2 n=1 Tax=Heterocephalus glaber TaxID=10181 RepID=A0AAX6NQJ6_HETGA|nr:tctex1 domain-containing protein 2 isoform X2 [Heterocephalus glaber]